MDTDDLTAALLLLMDLVPTARRVLGAEHEQTLAVIESLAVLHGNMRNYHLALPLLLHAAHGKPGVFVELGALDGSSLSNTYALEKCFGWRGVLIEADPDNFNAMKAGDRVSSRVHAAVCDNQLGSIPISRSKNRPSSIHQ